MSCQIKNKNRPSETTCLFPTDAQAADSSLSGDLGSVDQVDNTLIACGLIGLAVLAPFISLILAIGIFLYRRHMENKSLKNRKTLHLMNDVPSISVTEGYDENL